MKIFILLISPNLTKTPLSTPQNPAPNVNTGEVVQSATASKNADHSVEASQVAHAQKPPAAIPQRPVNNIQQPRKC